MSKLLVVFFATGRQGNSVIDYVINDSTLSKVFKVRGVTRDPSKPEALALLKKGVEVVKGDMDDMDSLKQAMQGAHTVFAATFTVYDDQMEARERAQGKALADAAVEEGVQYLIFSTLPHTKKISNGVYTVATFDVKAETEQYIRGLPLDSAFFSPGSFMQNHLDMFAPYPVGDGTYAFSHVVSPQAPFPLIDTIGDTGKYVGAILAEPDKYKGKVFSAATKLYTFDEVAQAISKATGKDVKYKQISVDDTKRALPPIVANYVVPMMKYIEDFGYYGSNTVELVEWSARNARGKLTTLEEFFAKNPVSLH
ncbi:hypothetical protein KI688_006562 [Linnemannia hyalina]|uniref:NmrA-like domain-containing protein n=1 Tax=Linnemannia hyalina TaxID=64524 RepID=A0A9P8BNH0_9FUNG|nr:hypothetical protein KI688_006562 [Linnemannia hyalina]